ncbi:MAG: bifunctional [glutamate--ammonia ligase]-adenylyl-L-tyrosine phosphorylase/[glutamate--ammonia-ligase] adenylyltransferase [Deltaproteobacteria bacterium]|nr:bifunctional [glutamate--ammonia ligase]-adenylyl-L-tyrosine phosphorylase/[glutamate--ammonia-ligase] adenylyltransferase [Deltaproteobacteria bacterium]
MPAEGQALLEKVRNFSPYLSQVLQQQPDLEEELFLRGGVRIRGSRKLLAQALQKKLGGRQDFPAFCATLRRFKQEVILGIAARDLGGIASLKEVTRELTDLAQVCLEAATAYCYREQIREKGWDPIFLEKKGLLVLGLGKFGGEELNFSSDIDLIFLYQTHPELPFSGPEQREFYQGLTRRITQALGSLVNGDLVFRVDLNLRPGGKDSEPALSLDSALEYYQSEARTWERLALIKTRPVVGSPDLGRLFLKAVRPVIYRRFMDYTILAEIRQIKEHILKETRSHLLAGDNIKLGPGGIREIEFIVQALQIVFGGRLPAVQERNTLKALRKLHQATILPRQEYRDLYQAYVFLRSLEHRIQMRHQRQTHALPQDEGILEQIARHLPRAKRSSPPGLEMFRRELARVRNRVQRIFGNLLLASAPVPQQQIRNLLGPTEPIDWEKELQALGFQNRSAVQEVLTYWRKRQASLQAQPKEKEILIRLYPALLGVVAQTPDPDQALFFLDRYLRSAGGRLGILSMLLERASLVREILLLFARSALLARLFIQNPEMIDRLALRRETSLSFVSDWPAPLPRRKGPTADPEEDLGRLRQWKNEHILEIALEEMGGRLGPQKTAHWLTRLADRVILETGWIAEETLNREVRPPLAPAPSREQAGPPFCLLGLGKLGGRGLGYASDLDLMFIYSLKNIPAKGTPAKIQSTGKDRRPRITWHEYLVRLAQRLISYMSLSLKEGPGYTVDTRLRPSGTFGPLVVSLEAFREYYRHQAQNWERQMLLKARMISGPEGLTRLVEEEIRQILYQAPPPPENREEMVYYRRRMETERSGEGPDRYNPKLGYGGLTDIEFIAQYLQQNNGFQTPEVRGTDTLEILKALQSLGLLAEERSRTLRESHQFLTSLDHGLQLLLDRREEPRAYSSTEMARLEKLNLMGLGEAPIPSWDLLEHYRRVTRNVRSIFNGIFSINNKKGGSDRKGGL